MLIRLIKLCGLVGMVAGGWHLFMNLGSVANPEMLKRANFGGWVFVVSVLHFVGATIFEVRLERRRQTVLSEKSS